MSLTRPPKSGRSVITYEAPAKLNLSLIVGPPQPSGHHPLRSLVQTIEWADLLTVERGEESDSLEVHGADLDPEDNLVLRALQLLRSHASVPALTMTLDKRIPIAAGLGGGSSDAAAVLRAAGDLTPLPEAVLIETSPEVGADVRLFLIGGTLEMSGVGSDLGQLAHLEGFAVAVAVPPFELITADVYRRWDELEGPKGETVPDDLLPPPLRGVMPMRNDLLPAALDLEPRLGDFMADLRSWWAGAVCLTGSGSGCFGYFPTVDEAASAASSVAAGCREAAGAGLRPKGVDRVVQVAP